MGAASFVLAINIFIAGLFTAAFGIIAWRNRNAVGARWLALAYALGVLNCILEFVLTWQSDARLLSLVVFSVALAAFLVCVIGLARHYNVRVPWLALGTIAAVSVGANGVMLDLPPDNFEHAMVYQTPYFIAHLLGAYVVFKGPRRGGLDIALLIFLLVSGLQFLAKPFMAASLGNSTTELYLYSLYGAYSQMLTAFLLIANGVLMLLIIVRDVMAEITARSETDKLSGMLNRRGFEDRTTKAVLNAHRSSTAGAMVVADLDYFKQVNDTYGHEMGDQVIIAFARVLQSNATPTMIAGRLGGEEFAVFVPNGSLAAARLFAETARAAVPDMHVIGLDTRHGVAASFGVAPLLPGDTLSDVLRRADAALYDAKRSGRNRVSVTQPSTAVPSTPPTKSPPPRRRNGSRQD